MKTIAVISAHGQSLAAFKRHQKFWAHHDDVMVVSPENDPLLPIQFPTWKNVGVGMAEHNGRESIKRFQWIMGHLQDRTDWDWCVMHEYDSFFLEHRLPEYPGFYGVLWQNKESPGYMAPIYANPPWTFDRDSLLQMTAVAERYKGIFENGEADRYWSALAYLSRVPILPYGPPGFSRGTIGPKDIPALRGAIYGGAYAIHGVKQEWVLKAVEQFWDERPKIVPRGTIQP